jgi:hypothetical protein
MVLAIFLTSRCLGFCYFKLVKINTKTVFNNNAHLLTSLPLTENYIIFSWSEEFFKTADEVDGN